MPTAFELLSGVSLPQNGDDWHALRNGQYTLPSVNRELEQILHSLLAPSPQNRLTASTCIIKFPSLQSQLEKELNFQKQQTKTLQAQLDNALTELKTHQPYGGGFKQPSARATLQVRRLHSFS